MVDTTIPCPNKEIKLIDFSNKSHVAPLIKVGNLPFFRAIKHHQVHTTCSEVSVPASLRGHVQQWVLEKLHAPGPNRCWTSRLAHALL